MALFPSFISGPRFSRAVAIANCVHYCGFRYGRGEFNPYENYIVGLANGVSREILRTRFVDFIRHYRPHDLGEALGVRTERVIPLWLLPWKSWRKLMRPGGWSESPTSVVDIMTHFSPKGILLSHIMQEYRWLEQAWKNISRNGYQPKWYSYIEVFELRGTHESRFIVVDGNHRLSALAALGQSEVWVRRMPWAIAHRSRARYWPLVISGHVSPGDALRIFDAYFCGNATCHRAPVPAEILND
jgi:hypothetical protein